MANTINSIEEPTTPSFILGGVTICLIIVAEIDKENEYSVIKGVPFHPPPQKKINK